MNTPLIKLWVKGTLVMLASYNLIWGLLLYNYPEAYLTWVGVADGVAIAENAVSIGILYLLQAAFFTALPILISRRGAWLFAALLLKVSSIVTTLYMLNDIAISKKLYFQVVSNDVFCLILLVFIFFQINSTTSIKK
jgi:hypothetical protein